MHMLALIVQIYPDGHTHTHTGTVRTHLARRQPASCYDAAASPAWPWGRGRGSVWLWLGLCRRSNGHENMWLYRPMLLCSWCHLPLLTVNSLLKFLFLKSSLPGKSCHCIASFNHSFYIFSFYKCSWSSRQFSYDPCSRNICMARQVTEHPLVSQQFHSSPDRKEV